jgi:hypothetical protein
MKIKIAKFSLIGFTLAVLLTANFAFAQNQTTTANDPSKLTPEINTKWHEMEGYFSQIESLIIGHGYSRDSDKVKPLIESAKNDCTQLAGMIQTASKNQATTYWLEANSFIQSRPTCLIRSVANIKNGTMNATETAVSSQITSALATSNTTSLNNIFSQEDIYKQAETAANVNPLSKIVGYIVDALLNTVTAAIASLAALMGKLMNWAMSASAVQLQPAIVSQGWGLVRDFLNMFFILALIIISLGTILRLRDYKTSAGTLVLNLILMALLINFSKVIVENLVKASDAVTHIMLANVKLDQIFATLTSVFREGFFAGASGGFLHALTLDIGRLFFAVITLFTFMALTFLFFVRTIGVWVLIILSPAAFALRILPFTKKYSEQWIGLFTKYLIWPPVASFFIFLSYSLLATYKPDVAGRFGWGIDIDFFIITALLWGAYLTARATGMQGAAFVTKLTDKGLAGFTDAGKITARYFARGSALKHAGGALEKRTGISFVKKAGEKWQGGAQAIEAMPDTAKRALEQFSKDYSKGVGKKQRGQLRTLSKILPFDAESFEKDDIGKWDADEAYKVIKERINDGKFSGADFRDLVPNLNRKALRGLVKLWDDRGTMGANWTTGHTEVLDESLKRKLGTGDLDGNQLLNILPAGTTPAPGVNGFVYDPTADDSYNMRAVVDKKVGKGRGGARKQFEVKMDASYTGPDLADFGTQEQEVHREAEFKTLTDKFNRTVEAAKALTNDPDAENKLRERAFTVKDVFAPEEINRVRDEIKDHLGVNLRVDLDPKWGSLLSRSGQRVKLSAKAASDERIGMDTNEARYYPKEQIGELVQVLRESGEMNEASIQKMVAAAERAGGIQVVRGVPRTDQRALEEVVNAQVKFEPVEIRTARQTQGNHEGTHSVLNLIQRSNKELYRNIVEKITNFDSKKFGELEQEIRSIPSYKNISQADIVEEMISNPKFASKLDSKLVGEVRELLAPAIQKHQELRIKAGRELRSEDRVNQLATKLEKRNQSVPDSAKQFDFKV